MKPTRILPVLLLVSACAAPNAPSQPAPEGGKLVQFEDGRNCWNNRCVRFDKRDRAISVTGRHPVSVPRDIDVRAGYVTEAEFVQMFETANRSLSRGVGRR